VDLLSTALTPSRLCRHGAASHGLHGYGYYDGAPGGVLGSWSLPAGVAHSRAPDPLPWYHPSVLVACLTLALATAPTGDNPHLVDARGSFDALQFDQTLGHLGLALSMPLSRAELLEVYELQGITFAILSRWKKAAERFRRLLMIDPKHQLPDYVAPRFRRYFLETRERFESAGWLEVRDTTPPHPGAGDPVFVTLKMENDPLAMVAGVIVRYRATEQPTWREERLPAGPATRVRLDIAPTSTAFEYHWTVLDSRGSELAFVGTADEPLRLELGNSDAPAAALAATADGEPLWQRWWVWTIVGVVAAGAVTTTVVLATQPSTPECPGNAVCAGF